MSVSIDDNNEFLLAHSALEIEREILGNREIPLLKLLMQIADILLLPQVN